MLNCYYAHAEQDDGAQVTPRVPALSQGVRGCGSRRRRGAAGPATPSANAARVRRRERASSSMKSWAGALAAAAALTADPRACAARTCARLGRADRGSEPRLTAGAEHAVVRARAHAARAPRRARACSGAATGCWRARTTSCWCTTSTSTSPRGAPRRRRPASSTTSCAAWAPRSRRAWPRCAPGQPPAVRSCAEPPPRHPNSALPTLTAGLCFRGGCCPPASPLARAIPLSGRQVWGAPRAPASGAPCSAATQGRAAPDPRARRAAGRAAAAAPAAQHRAAAARRGRPLRAAAAHHVL